MIFQVSGTGPFPIDMLRHDRCSPASECDSGQIAKTFQPRNRQERVVNLFRPGAQMPTEGRWASFGWTVEPMDSPRAYSC